MIIHLINNIEMEKEKLNLLEQFGYSKELIKVISEYPELDYQKPFQINDEQINYNSFNYSGSDMNEFELVGKYNLDSEVVGN